MRKWLEILRKNIFRQAITIAAVAVLLLSQSMSIWATALDGTQGNIILYNGSSMQNVQLVGSVNGLNLRKVSSATKYGDAYAINPIQLQAGNNSRVTMSMTAMGSFDLTSAVGMALYTKVPQAGLTNFYLRLSNDSETIIAAGSMNVAVTYVGKDGNRSNETDDYLCEDKQGYEGFIFVPFSSFTFEAYTDSSMTMSDLLQQVQADKGAGWNIEIYHYKWAYADLTYDYLFDNIGFYSDIDGYIEQAKAELMPPKYLLYDGTETEDIKIKGVTTAMTAHVVENATQYGYALALNPMVTLGGGWAAMSLARMGTLDLSETKGLALYVKLPNVNLTNVDIRLINDNWTSWAGVGNNVEITYVSKDKVKSVHTQEYLMENSQEYEGFVFIPYEAFTAGNIAINDLLALIQKDSGSGWSIELGHYKWSMDDVGPNYLYDNIGLYTDIDAYISLVDSHEEIPPKKVPSIQGGEWIVNEAELSGVELSPQTPNADIEIKQTTDCSRYGKGVVINPTKVQGTGWASVPVQRPAEFSLNGTSGIVTYVRFPESAAHTDLMIRLAKNDGSKSYTIKNNVTLTLVDKDGVKTVKTQSLPYENLQGYEGFVFIPYTELQSDTQSVNAAELDEWTNWAIEIAYSKTDDKDIGLDYNFYSIGFYTDMDAYVQLMNSRHPNFVANDGSSTDGIKIIGDPVVAGTPDLSVDTRWSNTQFGNALAINAMVFRGNQWASIPIKKPENFDFTDTKGVALYLKFPSTALNTHFMLRLINDDSGEEYKIGLNVNLKLVTSTGLRTAVQQAYPFENMTSYEGFAFVPFEALNIMDPAILNNWQNWSLQIYYYKYFDQDLNVDFLYDNIGFYHDEDEYMQVCGASISAIAPPEAYYTDETDNLGWYMINNMLDANAVTFGGAGVDVESTEQVEDGHGLKLYAHNESSVVFNSFRKGEKQLQKTAGIMLYVRAGQSLSEWEFGVGLTDETNPSAVEYYEFDSYEGDYYYAPFGEKLFRVSRDAVRLPAGFEGFIYFPFENFIPAAGSIPDNLTVDADGITKVHLMARTNNTAQTQLEIVVDNLMLYASQGLLETMVGAPHNPRDYTLTVEGESGKMAIVFEDTIRLYDADMTYETLLKDLKVVGDVTFQILDNSSKPVKPTDKIGASFVVAIVRNEQVIKQYAASLITNDIIPDEKVVVQAGKPGKPPHEITGTDTVYVEVFPANTGEDSVTGLVTIKRSARAYLERLTDGIQVLQNMTAVRFLSAFNMSDGVTLSLTDNEGNPCADGDSVMNGHVLVVKWDGEEVGKYPVRTDKNDTDQLPENNDSQVGNTQENPQGTVMTWLWIAIGAAGVVIAFGAVMLIVRKKVK